MKKKPAPHPRLPRPIPAFRRRLLTWFARNRRDLPWRRRRDPYRVWLAEIMLQQTRVEAGISYYEAFLRRFPDVASLADASEEAVLKAWEGLGYYSRARNLHRAAKLVARERGGAFPATARELARLPGVGRYTAAAVASIAFGEAAAVVDGNVKRVLARLLRVEEPVDAAATEALLWEAAEALLAPRRAGDFNEAMMELGALVCVPKRPRCASCPVATHCEALRAGVEQELPRKKTKKAVPHRLRVAAAVAYRGRWLLVRRPSEGFLGGLWEFPGGEPEADEDMVVALERVLGERFGLGVEGVERCGTVRHVYSHFSLETEAFRGRRAGGRLRARAHAQTAWIRPERIDRYPLSTADRKLLALFRAEA